MYENNETLEPNCAYCSSKLFEPYIKCVECENIYLCTLCFSKGEEIDGHENQHKYYVIKNNFPLFDNCNWTAKDEYLLLKYVDEHGYGNWEEISKSIQNHSKLECQEHYKKFYIDNTLHEELPQLRSPDSYTLNDFKYPFLLKETNNDDPPRQYSTTKTQQIAGYNAYRSEFELNFDNNAENILNLQHEIDNEDDNLMKNLQCSLVLAYNSKLRERKRRYEVIRNHGLIVLRKFYRWYKKFDDTLGTQICERLVVFMQLLSGMQFDAFVENLSMEKELQIYLHKLYEYRRNGLKSLRACKLYHNMKRKEELNNKEFKAYLSNVKLDWKGLSQGNTNWPNETTSLWTDPKDIKMNRTRKSATPLEIIGLPGYDKLTEKERDFCSSVRLVPENFTLFREILVNENNKNGFLRLLDARKLIKIDVNKTRKLYDYLITEGFINQPK